MSPIVIYYSPPEKKIEQKFRSILKEAKEQIPPTNRGILIIQGLDENRASEILQERIGFPEYQNIIAVVAINNGVTAVMRDDHDVDINFIGSCVSHSLFYDYDLGN